MELEEKLFALMAIAEEHQIAVDQVLKALKSEHIAIAADRVHNNATAGSQDRREGGHASVARRGTQSVYAYIP